MDVLISDWAWIPLSEYPPEKLVRLRDAMTIIPRRTSEYQTEILPIRLYCERDGHIGIPREYFLSHRKLHHKIIDDMSRGHPVELKFGGTLKEDQQRALFVVFKAVEQGVSGGIIQAAPGYGKTVVALAIWVSLGCTAIVTVQKEFLAAQWKERIRQFVPDARVGIIQQDKCQFGEDYDIAIATLQSLSARKDDYPAEMWKWPGLILSDETHRVGAPQWADVVPKFPAFFRLGLTATPRRKDGADNVFFWHLGKVLYRSKQKRVVPKLRRIITDFSFFKTPKFDPNEVSKEIQLRFLCSNPARNQLIVNELVKAAKAGRKVIVLSERRKHLETLREMFGLVKPEGCTVDFYVGGRTLRELKTAEGADILLCTYQMTKEALDIPRLDTMFLTTPMADVEQAVGRIMREHPDKKEPIVTDFIDGKVKRFARLWNSRRRFYKKTGMFVEE